ncbi:hypothetical protein ACIO1C_29775 [Streptomyces sp. NPDC087420]|uniref:hypothetical protein n=1 Tax=Streptomyces sp. NPDC087420 TaxID=3365785 RepID=UPI003832C417
MNEIDYAARVAKGAALLDEKRPGWEREVDLDVLDIANGAVCVTAQLSGRSDFRTGMKQLDLTSGDDGTYVLHGFNAESADTPEAYGLDDTKDSDVVLDAQNAAYDTLNTLWRALITTRLAVPSDGA